MHCQRNANNRQTDGFSDSVETGLAQQPDCADCLLGSEFQTVGPAEAKERQPKDKHKYIKYKLVERGLQIV